MNNNPTGRNQYTGSLRNRSTNLYHGSDRVFARLDPKKAFGSREVFATTSIKLASVYAKLKSRNSGKPARLLQVGMGKYTSLIQFRGEGASLAKSTRAMPVIRSIKLLKRQRFNK